MFICIAYVFKIYINGVRMSDILQPVTFRNGNTLLRVLGQQHVTQYDGFPCPSSKNPCEPQGVCISVLNEHLCRCHGRNVTLKSCQSEWFSLNQLIIFHWNWNLSSSQVYSSLFWRRWGSELPNQNWRVRWIFYSDLAVRHLGHINKLWLPLLLLIFRSIAKTF